MINRTTNERAIIIDRFVMSQATQPLVKAIRRILPVMTLEEMAGLYEHVRVQAWIEVRSRAINRGEKFPEFKDFEL